MKKISFLSILLLTACVTINIYFPAAAAEKVADEIIKGIQSEESSEIVPDDDITLPQSKTQNLQIVIYQVIDNLLNVIVSPAYAEANLSVNTVGISRLRSSMQARFSALKPFYANGIVGLKSDGFIIAKGAIPLRNRNQVNTLIAAENSDRQQLYQAIANANGHPEWAAQIQTTFASRWISNAQSGWWYQSSNGSWTQK